MSDFQNHHMRPYSRPTATPPTYHRRVDSAVPGVRQRYGSHRVPTVLRRFPHAVPPARPSFLEASAV